MIEEMKNMIIMKKIITNIKIEKIQISIKKINKIILNNNF